MITKSISELLKGNSYPGRGIIAGMSDDGKKAVTAYFIMGRSSNSRNRVFRKDGKGIIIYPFDESKVEDPSLIIYSPVRVIDECTIVTNGDQTDTIYYYIQNGGTFEDALDTRCFEPDAPNYTPRISALLDLPDDGFSYKMSILKCTDGKGEKCGRYTFSYEPEPGVGHFIHTYMHDGDPIPSFEGEPERIIIGSDIDAFTEEIWDSLDNDNRVSLYVRYICLNDHSVKEKIINSNE